MNLSIGGAISGMTSATLTINPIAATDNAAAFDCIVTNTCGSVRSNPAGLAVSPHLPNATPISPAAAPARPRP